MQYVERTYRQHSGGQILMWVDVLTLDTRKLRYLVFAQILFATSNPAI